MNKVLHNIAPEAIKNINNSVYNLVLRSRKIHSADAYYARVFMFSQCHNILCLIFMFYLNKYFKLHLIARGTKVKYFPLYLNLIT